MLGRLAPVSPRHTTVGNTLASLVAYDSCLVSLKATQSAGALQTLDSGDAEVNQVAVHGGLLGCANDDGRVTVFDIQSGRLHRCKQRGHTNICSSVAFRQVSRLYSNTCCKCWPQELPIHSASAVAGVQVGVAERGTRL